MITIIKIWLTEDAVWIRTADGQEASEKFEDYPRLRHATKAQRTNYQADGYGIHWPDLDEDLSFEGFFQTKPKTELYRIFMSHPELNASAIARRLGISQSLFAQYICGVKRPSKARMADIYSALHTLGKELMDIAPSD